MSDPGNVVITGAAGNLGAKLRRHLEGRYPLRLLDRDPRGDPAVVAAGQARDSSAYGAAKLFGERLGLSLTETQPGMSVLAVRIGWVRPGANRPQDIPPERDAWFRLMWLSNRDYCQLMECCLRADPALG